MIEGLKPYNSLCTSGDPWLGTVPSHWTRKRLCSISTPRVKRNPGNLPLLSVFLDRGVIPYGEGGGQVHAPSLDLSNYQVVYPGDFVLNNQQAWRGSVGVSQHHGIISPAYIVLKLNHELHPAYANSLFRCPRLVDQFVAASKGVGDIQRQTYWPFLRRVIVPIPSREEQAAIVRFLDHANRRIDRYIRAKRKLIALLHEQKQAIIHRAVTRGLDPNVPLKDSGVPWLGEIPMHWEVTRLKFIARKITDGEHISPMLASNGIPLLSAKDVRDRVINYAVNKFVSREDAEMFWRRCRPEKGDILIVSRGATIGRIATVDMSTPFCLMGSVILVKPAHQYDNEFLYYALNAKHAQTALWFSSASSAQQALYIKDIAELCLPMPPTDERCAIVRRLNALLANFEPEFASLQHQIALIREYRTRLTADVVTGQLDVREAAARLPAEAEGDEPPLDEGVEEELEAGEDETAE